MHHLNYDKNSVKIFKYLFNTEKEIKLMAVSGDDYEAIDSQHDKMGVYWEYEPEKESIVSHITCERYFRNINFNNVVKEKNRFVVFWYPETGMSIREQQKFCYELVQKYINSNEEDITLIIFTNSLWILSDVPSSNVTVFNKEYCSSAEDKFFGGNLIDILANFSPDIMTGKLSAEYAEKIINFATEHAEDKNDGHIDRELVDFIEDRILKGYIKSQLKLF